MPASLSEHSYGKSNVRLTKVVRHTDRHDLTELSVDICLGGDFEAAYTLGDNSKVIATDSMKNTVYVIAKKHELSNPESFALALAKHFLDTYPQVFEATINVRQSTWHRIPIDGKPHPHAFVAGSREQRLCNIFRNRDGATVEAGVDHLLLLKTTNSAFSGFVRDAYTTLRDTDDRIMATNLLAKWNYATTDGDWNGTYAIVRAALLDVFANHKSLAVQQTLYAMGQAVLEQCPQIDRISLEMPNQHRIRIDLSPFGMENENEIFVPTDEPFGMISATLKREGPAPSQALPIPVKP